MNFKTLDTEEESSLVDLDQTQGSVWKDVIKNRKTKAKEAVLQNILQTQYCLIPRQDTVPSGQGTARLLAKILERNTEING